MMRFSRPLAVALFVVAMAVTPLTAATSGGHFEYRYPARGAMDSFGHRVVVLDRTGMVAGIGPAGSEHAGRVSNIGNSGNWLGVNWSAGGCETDSRLVLVRVGVRYRIDVTSGGVGCGFLNLTGYSIVLKLWSPIDAATVEVVSRYDSPR
ncbi:MAG: hypothetical protein ABIP53_05190 [Candidatus Limnocylindrales bacterium]